MCGDDDDLRGTKPICFLHLFNKHTLLSRACAITSLTGKITIPISRQQCIITQ